MKTNLDRKIEDYGDAINYLADLVANNESFHPDDPIDECFEGISDEDVRKMETLMDSVFKYVDDPYEVLLLFLKMVERISLTRHIVAQRITLEATLLKLEEEADELLNCGNSHEQARGSGIKTAIERFRVV